MPMHLVNDNSIKDENKAKAGELPANAKKRKRQEEGEEGLKQEHAEDVKKSVFVSQTGVAHKLSAQSSTH